MKSSLTSKALLFNLDAHRANLPNLIAGALGMIANNTIFLVGIWGMLFAGKTKNNELLPYFLALYAVVTASWGLVNFFFGGLRILGDFITDGTLEPMLATPRSPLLLAAISRSSPIALGDLVMGLVGIILIGLKLDPAFALRCYVAVLVSAIGFAGMFVFAGSVSFFIPRGSAVGQLIIESMISTSIYPTGKMFAGAGRIVLLLTPAAVTAILPMEAVEKAGWGSFLVSLGASMAFFLFSVLLFRLGVRRYRAVSIIGAQG